MNSERPMFITKKHISRRAVLKAAGVALGLPFLDAMVPAGTALAQTAAVPRLRTGFFYIPHGAIMGNTSHGPALDKWTPSGSGADFKLSPILASLEPYKKYVSSFGGLENAATAGSVHSFTPATWLSATRPDTGAPRAHMATTLDQVIAKFIGQETPLPSLEVASETTMQSAAGSDGYLESGREIERRTQKAGAKDLSALKIPEAPVGELDSFPEQVKLMFDLIALAYQADLTRVASYIMVAEGTIRTYNHIGVPDSFHPVSHHANDLERINKLVKIQTWHLEQFAAFVKKMAETPDGPGTLLDHSIFMYGSNMSNSDRHDNYPEPNILVGGGNGKMKLGGQHIVLPGRTPIANLHLTLLQKIGVERDKFGDSTGTIAGI